MSDLLLDGAGGLQIPIHACLETELAVKLEADTDLVKALAGLAGFQARAGQVLIVPNADGGAERVLFGLGAHADVMCFRALPAILPAGVYRIATAPDGLDLEQAALAFALGGYRFGRYKPAGPVRARLAMVGVDLDDVRRIADACALARTMIDTPANDMGPLQIEMIARTIAEQQGAAIMVVTGDDLLTANYPAVHAVGRAAAPHRAPRMIELTWGDPGHAPVALVGKGVAFDSGGLDIKSALNMRLMKKDMGGAAHALALAQMIMAARLPLRLTVLIPAVENAISGDAMRPGDVLPSRKGLTIEVGNTDAEGRLILADALTRASELDPVLTIDLATLTGAARVALGPQVAPFFTNDENLADELESAMARVGDPLWRMPLWTPYAEALESDLADLRNDPDGWTQAGAVTAALFLRRFAPTRGWVHFDIFAWNPRDRPGWPVGAEVQAIRAIYRMIQTRFG